MYCLLISHARNLSDPVLHVYVVAFVDDIFTFWLIGVSFCIRNASPGRRATVHSSLSHVDRIMQITIIHYLK